MPSPRHLPRAASRRRRLQRWLALAVVLVAGVLVAAVRRDDDPQLTASRSAPSVSTTVVTSTSVPVTTTLATTTTSVAPTTTSPAPAPVAVWYAVVRSAVKEGTDREALRAEVAEHGDRGTVVDTDDFRTGDGQPPDYFPAPGLLVAVVGPFDTRAEVWAWCAGYDSELGCQARRFVPR